MYPKVLLKPNCILSTIHAPHCILRRQILHVKGILPTKHFLLGQFLFLSLFFSARMSHGNASFAHEKEPLLEAVTHISEFIRYKLLVDSG
jgi:hypothetical protein